MGEDLFTRLKKWYCEKFGHKFDLDKLWSYNGIHGVCNRCKTVITISDGKYKQES